MDVTVKIEFSIVRGVDMDVKVFCAFASVVVAMDAGLMDEIDLNVTLGAVEVMLVWALTAEPLEIRLTTANNRIVLNTILVSISTHLPILTRCNRLRGIAGSLYAEWMNHPYQSN
jgi:hypothetical protein